VAAFTRSIVTGWLPALLLNLWLVMVLPRMVYLVVQVGLGAWGGLPCGRAAAAAPPPGAILIPPPAA
jgi:hypothetical protein